MKKFVILTFLFFGTGIISTYASESSALTFYKAGNSYFQYTGRIDFSNPDLPRFWSPGIYIGARFKGNRCRDFRFYQENQKMVITD